ncbi:hypothetical protein [Kribbella sp. HUAS MG21]|uniref:GNAT family N-acetyltransferase n=1 Tax=Kribbella sp. HUAS MG21 TaxID=3160966 RepID=A0AAU7TB65_9ACTN
MHQLHTEVVRHHDNLATWLGSEADPELLDAFHRAHHPDFTLTWWCAGTSNGTRSVGFAG